MKKRIKRKFNICIFSIIILIIIFYLTKIFSLNIFKILLGIWVCGVLIACGIIGLLTNSILLSRGGDLEYKPNSILGKIGNFIIIIMGVALLITFIAIQ